MSNGVASRRMLEYKIPAERINVGCISGQTERNAILLRC